MVAEGSSRQLATKKSNYKITDQIVALYSLRLQVVIYQYHFQAKPCLGFNFQKILLMISFNSPQLLSTSNHLNISIRLSFMHNRENKQLKVGKEDTTLPASFLIISIPVPFFLQVHFLLRKLGSWQLQVAVGSQLPSTHFQKF